MDKGKKRLEDRICICKDDICKMVKQKLMREEEKLNREEEK
jgi:hypothetical protein